MLDIKFIAENKEIVVEAVKNKNRSVDIDQLLQVNEERKVLRQKLDDLNKQKNEAAAARDIEKGTEIKGLLEGAEKDFEVINKKFVDLMKLVPNIPSPDTPIGKDESENVAIRSWGEKPVFNFEPKPHWDLGKKLGIIDSEKAAEISGSRFTYIKGDLALLEFAVMNFVIKVLTSPDIIKDIITAKGLSISTKPFIPVIPPLMMRPEVMNRMARLDPIEDRFFFEKDNLIFIGSAEHTLGPLHMDETIQEDMLPLRYCALTPAFRREAGAAGKDTRGILRLHQFNKLEMESFTKPEDGLLEQEFMVAIQEYIMQQLILPYQVISICTGDMGFPDQRQLDIDTWMPGQSTYRETHTSDYVGGFQARRLNTKVKRNDGTSEPVHMNDATALSERALIAIMENYQQEDGTILVPEILRSYIGKDKIGS